MTPLKGKCVVILGASSGIGAEIGTYCLKQGASVHFVARREERLITQVASVEDAISRASYSVCDATDYLAIHQMMEEVYQKYSTVDLWINCTGQNKAIGKFWELNPQTIWEEVEVNLKSCMNGTHVALGQMVKANKGIIINFCGGGAAHPHLYAAAYSASKTAIARFTEATMLELEKEESNVKVFAVNPGLVYNERTAALCESEEGKRFMPEIECAFAEGRCQPAETVIKFIEATLTGDLNEYAGRLVQAPKNLQALTEKNSELKGTLTGFLRPVH